jgi:alkylation response protein AidB-like acyl-CoA dehydrogenase
MDVSLSSTWDSDSAALIGILSGEQALSYRAAPDSDQFPEDMMDLLRRSGFLAAPLLRSEGGLGWGTENRGIIPLCAALQVLGSRSLPVGRIYEAHVNALALVMRYGSSQVRATASAAVRRGNLFALWVAPSAHRVKVFRSGSVLRLSGRKAFCTAAGFAASVVITAQNEDDLEQMIIIDASLANVEPDSVTALHGMRSTSTKAVAFDCEVTPEQFVGKPGDYVREPDFSVGAWRTSAVTVGGLQALVDETIRQLQARDRHTDPHQAARIGQMLMKFHTAAMWVRSAAERSMSDRDEPQHLTAYVNLTRLAVEQACLEVVPLVQRSLGLSSLMVGNPVESLMRDLATYLRQPAGDEALTEAAINFAQTPIPSLLGLS